MSNTTENTVMKVIMIIIYQQTLQMYVYII